MNPPIKKCPTCGSFWCGVVCRFYGVDIYKLFKKAK